MVTKNLSNLCIKDKYIMPFTLLPLEPIFPMIQPDYIIHYLSWQLNIKVQASMLASFTMTSSWLFYISLTWSSTRRHKGHNKVVLTSWEALQSKLIYNIKPRAPSTDISMSTQSIYDAKNNRHEVNTGESSAFSFHHQIRATFVSSWKSTYSDCESSWTLTDV